MNKQLWIFVATLALFATFARAQTVEYIHTDALGSPVAVTNASGTVIERTVYEPYGAVINRPLTNGPEYTGHVADAVTGLNYMQQRYYDPQLGRFLSVDPISADGSTGGNFNRYWYADNNPYTNKDATGKFCAPAISHETLCSRSRMYERIDRESRINSKTRFFGAAAMVTNALGSSRFRVSAFMEQLSDRLEKQNLKRAEQIREGTLYTSGSVKENDAAFVKFEQTLVQEELDAYAKRDPQGYSDLVSEANDALNGVLSERFGDKNFARALEIAKKEVGGTIDFAKQDHREAIGRAAAEVVREKKSHYCTGSIIRKC